MYMYMEVTVQEKLILVQGYRAPTEYGNGSGMEWVLPMGMQREWKLN